MEFSVIIPVFNSEKYIKNCIDSLLCQTYSDWEAIIVNDGSTDNSALICDEYAKKDCRIRVIHIENGGVSNARNIGIKSAHGKRIMFLDSDDRLIRNTFEELAVIIKEYDYDVICWAVRTDGESPVYYSLCEKESWAKECDRDKLYDLRLRAFTGWSVRNEKDLGMHFVVSKMIKKELILNNDIWFSNKLKYHEDTLFSVEILENAKSIAALNRFFYIRTLHDESASVSFCNTIDEGNRNALLMFNDFIEKYHKGDEKYKVAYAKYQLAWFVQTLRLDYLHKQSSYTIKERLFKIKDVLKSNVYTPHLSVLHKNLKLSHRILMMLLRCKMVLIIYLTLKK